MDAFWPLRPPIVTPSFVRQFCNALRSWCLPAGPPTAILFVMASEPGTTASGVLSEGLHTVAMPSAVQARRFYRAAKQRFDDALLLLEMERTTAAIYVAGYS